MLTHREPFTLDTDATRKALESNQIIKREFAPGDAVALLISPDLGNWHFVMTEVLREDPTARGFYLLEGYEQCGLHSSNIIPAAEVEAWEKTRLAPWLHATANG